MKTIVMIESIKTKHRGGRINTCRSIIIVWIRTLWSSRLNIQFGIDWFDKSRSILYKYSMWLWSRYKNIFRGILNCMDVLYCLTPTAEGNITHPCNSRYRGKMFLYIDQSHRIFVILYFNSKIINQNKKECINKCKLTY